MRAWSQASQPAAQTLAERNRCADFLRAVSIPVVVTDQRQGGRYNVLRSIR